jgi:hypothetical protein
MKKATNEPVQKGTNTNCLKDIRCPKCGWEESFDIVMTVWAKATDDGVDEYSDPEFNHRSGIVCRDCDHRGRVKDFTIDPSIWGKK